MERQAVSLDGAWDFHFCGDAEIALEDIDHWRQCEVPAPWQAHFRAAPSNGRACTGARSSSSAEWLSETVYFRCGRSATTRGCW